MGAEPLEYYEKSFSERCFHNSFVSDGTIAPQNTSGWTIFREFIPTKPVRKVMFRERICSEQDEQLFQGNSVWKSQIFLPAVVAEKRFLDK